MTTTIQAIYRDGAFHPTSPPDLPDGTAVELRMEAPATDPQPDEPDAYDILSAITRRSARVGRVDDASVNHDKYLYGEPGDPGNVR